MQDWKCSGPGANDAVLLGRKQDADRFGGRQAAVADTGLTAAKGQAMVAGFMSSTLATGCGVTAGAGTPGHRR